MLKQPNQTKKKLMLHFFNCLKELRLMKTVRTVERESVTVHKKMAFLASSEGKYVCVKCSAHFINRYRTAHRCEHRTFMDYEWPKCKTQLFCLLCFKLFDQAVHLACHYLRKHSYDDVHNLGISPKLIHDLIS